MCLFVLIANHELSRDEVRAYSIARTAGDPIDLVRNKLVNEGHPPLWYLILWLGSRAWDDYTILKISCFLIALSLACLGFLASPFPLLHRCLLVLGVFPLYYLSVMCRSYGLAALLILLLAVEYTRKPMGSPWRIGWYGALLANTSMYGAIVACAFLLVPINDGTQRARRDRCLYLGIVAFLTTVGLVLSLYTMWPTQQNLVMNGKGMQNLRAGYATFAGEVLRSLYAIFIDQKGWIGFIVTGYLLQSKLSPLGYGWLGSVVGVVGLLVVFLFFVRWPRMLTAFGLCFVGSGLFSAIVYPASEAHIGIIATFVLALLWIAWSRYYTAASLSWRFVTIVLGLSLLAHASHGVRAGLLSLREPFSASKVAGAFLKQAYPNAIVICEPDAYGESLPYYTDNPIYLVREGEFGRWVHFERRFNRAVTLGEVMDVSIQMQQASRKIALVSLPKPIDEFQAGYFDWGYGRALQINDEDLRRFRSDFHEVAAFTQGVVETYVFYKGGTPP
jgi:hypothetical protein